MGVGGRYRWESYVDRAQRHDCGLDTTCIVFLV